MPNARPNIIIIMTDQQRADLTSRRRISAGYHALPRPLGGPRRLVQPRLHRHPRLRLRRISMLTGRFPSATRVRTNYNEADIYAATDLFRHFRALGYRTSLCGKNHSHLTAADVDDWFEAHHVGADDTHDDPRYEAFDGYVRKMHMHLSLTATPFPLECQLPYRIVSKAQRWLDSPSDQPFLLWLSFPEPHNPYQVPEPYFSLFPPESLPRCAAPPPTCPQRASPIAGADNLLKRHSPTIPQTIDRGRANYHGMLRLIDDQIDRLVQFCAQRRLLDNTILIFLSDHGDLVGEYGLLRKGPELPEPLVRIPLLFRGPGISPVAGPHAAHVGITDLFPTLCEAVGSEIPDGVQGRSLWPLLTGKPYDQAQFSSMYAEHGFGGLPYDGSETLDPTKDGLTLAGPDHSWGHSDGLNSRTQSGVLRMVRKGDWKLLLDNLNRGQLYNLTSDPAELHNLYNLPAAQEAQHSLTAELALWMLRTPGPASPAAPAITAAGIFSNDRNPLTAESSVVPGHFAAALLAAVSREPG